MDIDCPPTEFGFELCFFVPFCYWLYTQGLLKKTTSGLGTSCLYYFSPEHEEITQRTQRHCIPLPLINYDFNKPVDMSQWVLPDYKGHFKNTVYVYDKPILILHNKYTMEWGHDPINFIDIETLDILLRYLSNTYQVIYIRPLGNEKEYTTDDNTILDLDDHTYIRETYPDVLVFQDILGEYSYNQAQLMLHANCERFVSVHGATSLLASMFAGTNIILSRKGKPFKSEFYPKMSGAVIKEATTHEELVEYVKNTW